jgi:hypothetical protein
MRSRSAVTMNGQHAIFGLRDAPHRYVLQYALQVLIVSFDAREQERCQPQDERIIRSR